MTPPVMVHLAWNNSQSIKPSYKISELKSFKVRVRVLHKNINRTCKDDPTGHGTGREKERQAEKRDAKIII